MCGEYPRFTTRYDPSFERKPFSVASGGPKSILSAIQHRHSGVNLGSIRRPFPLRLNLSSGTPYSGISEGAICSMRTRVGRLGMRGDRGMGRWGLYGRSVFWGQGGIWQARRGAWRAWECCARGWPVEILAYGPLPHRGPWALPQCVPGFFALLRNSRTPGSPPL